MWPLNPAPLLALAVWTGARSAAPVPASAGAQLRPPPEVEFAARPAVPPAPSPSAPSPPAAWRQAAWWEAAVAAARAEDFPSPAPAPDKSLLADILLARCGREGGRGARARPDRALAERLWWWRLQAAWLPAEVRPWLRAQARAADYRQLRAREAELFDEFLAQEIPVTDD